MPNFIEPGPTTPVSTALRELALVAHALPRAELSVELRDGRRFVVGPHPRALMSTCLLRRAVADAVAGVDVAWLAAIERAEFTAAHCRHLGAGLYGAWCDGRPLYAFTSDLAVEVLEVVFAALPECDLTVHVRADPALAMSLVTVEPDRCRDDRTARSLAREFQGTILAEELMWSLAATDR